MPNIIACNLNSYRKYRGRAYEHLARIGLTNVEIPCPEFSEVAAVQEQLDLYGLTATSLIVSCQMDADDVVARFSRALETVASMGVGRVFTSVNSGEIDKDFIYGRLQNMGDVAAEREIVVALETHPDLVTNSDVGLETMQCVNHPQIRINFDPANLYYFNRGLSATIELEKLIEYVAAVHLKDTYGGYKSWKFPALGEGVVDFPTLFQMFLLKGFCGPYTLELEGIQGEEIGCEEVEKRVERSLQYVQIQGLVG